MGHVSVFGLRWSGWWSGESGWVACTRIWEGWEGVILQCVVILCVDDMSRYLYIVLSGYLRILGAPSVSIMMHLVDICFLPCICLWQISKIQICLRVVIGPGLFSTSLAFMRRCTNHPAGPHCRLFQNTVSRDPIAGGGRGQHNLHNGLARWLVTAPPRVDCVV